MGRFLALLLLGIPTAYLALLAWVYFNQRNLQYFPTTRDSEGGGNANLLPWRDASGRFLGYVRQQAGTREAVLFFHGNAGEALDRAWLDDFFSRDVLLFVAEYPGYGGKPGSPSEESILKEALVLFEEAHRYGKIPIAVMGESLGTGVAAYVASQKPVTRIALISPFSSALDVAIAAYSFLPVKWLMQDRFDSMAFLKSVTAPLHVIHGDADQVIPIGLGRKLFEAYGGPKQMTVLSGIGHNDIVPALLRDPKAAAFRAFASGQL